MAMTAASFHQVNMPVAKLTKTLNGSSIQPILQGNANRDPVLISQQVFTGDIPFLKVFLHVQPIGSVFLPVIDDENHGHPFFLPQFQVRHFHAERDTPAISENLQRVRCFHLKQHVSVFNFAALIVSQHQEVNPIVRVHAVDGKTLEQDLPLHMVDADVGQHVLARAQFPFLGLPLPRHA